MYLITIAILLAFIWLTTRRDKLLINPVTVTCGLWLFLIFIYEFTTHQLYPLSNKFYFVLLLWVCPFSIAYFVLSSFSLNKGLRVEFVASDFIYKKIFILFFIFLMFIFVLLQLYEIKKYGIDGLFHYLREVNIDKSTSVVETSSLEQNINRITQFGYILLFIYVLKGYKFKLKPIFIILLLIQILSGANKFVIARFIFGYMAIIIASGKVGIKKIIFFTICLVLFFGAFNYLRSMNPGDFDALDTLQTYLLAPLPALDTYMLNSNSTALFTTKSFGEHVFSSLGGTTMLNPEYFENDNIVFTPLPVNVFTMMSSYFVDFRYEGIFWAGLLWGLFFGYIYIRAQKSEPHLILYAALFHILVLQFFADYLVTSHVRMHIVLMFALFFIIYHPKIKLEKK